MLRNTKVDQDQKRDVYGVGNALVDILAFVDFDFLKELNLEPGSMTLVDSENQADILQRLEETSLKLASGGSAANTMIAISQSGGSGIYAGKVAHDPHGEFYKKDMNTAGIEFDVEQAPETGPPTGTCVVLTTPDAERTMCTHLGVSTSLAASDIDVEHLASCKYSYIEGYLWDAEGPRAACVEAMEQSRRHGVQVAFTFSDPFLLDRFANDFREMVPKYCDIVFCNSDEAFHYCSTDSLDRCAELIGGQVELAFITMSEKGCLVVRDGNVTHVDGFPVDAVDTVGAGDAFAGGTLYGIANGRSPEEAARWGNFMASRVVSIPGARLHEPMTEQLEEVLS